MNIKPIYAHQCRETNTEQVPNKLQEISPSVAALVKAIGNQELKITEMMEAVGLKHRPTFLYNYLNPAIEAGLVSMLYPNSPRHPRQRYSLTPKGLIFLNQTAND